MSHAGDVQGGKAFGLLKAQQEERLEEINKQFLDDPKYSTDEDLPSKLETFKSEGKLQGGEGLRWGAGVSHIHGTMQKHGMDFCWWEARSLAAPLSTPWVPALGSQSPSPTSSACPLSSHSPVPQSPAPKPTARANPVCSPPRPEKYMEFDLNGNGDIGEKRAIWGSVRA